jgi:hypothetical protein
MSSRVFKFALVARTGVPLAEYPLDDTEIREKAIRILKRIDQTASFSVVEQQNFIFTASTTADGMCYVCLCDKNVETRRVGQFLGNLKTKWVQSYGTSAITLSQNEKDEEFGPCIQELLDHYNSLSPPPVETSPRPSDSENLVTERESVENPFVLQSAGGAIHQPDIPAGFRTDGQESLTGLRMKIWCQRYKWPVIIILGLVFWIYILMAFYCSDATLSKCFNP